ncbi:histamine H3 receptor-like [Anneissia japonica]|uniref:histamine H3 receptor-like n=1 Tax=Anneissia japonica TaxID=1529436 RepID=UPI001425A448|nr:histamine H3 receptor-like [Anneissia japonica]
MGISKVDSMDDNYTMNADTDLCTSNDSDGFMTSSEILDCYGDPENKWLFLFVLIIVWILTSATIFLNCLVLLSFAINRKIRSKPANVFILTLSLADLTVGVVSLPLGNIQLKYGYWAFGEIVCKLYLFIDYTACGVSAGCIVLLSLDRYWMVKRHLRYNAFMTHRKAFTLSLCLVLFFGIFYVLGIFLWELLTGKSNVDYNVGCGAGRKDNLTFIYLSVTIVFGLPFALLIYLNVNVYIGVINWSTGKNLQGGKNYRIEREKSKENHENHNLDRKNEKSDNMPVKQSSLRRFQGARRGSQTRKAAITLAALVTVFLICWLPYNIYIIIERPSSKFSNFGWIFVNYLLWINSAINPILYAVTNKEFRKTFARVIPLITNIIALPIQN